MGSRPTESSTAIGITATAHQFAAEFLLRFRLAPARRGRAEPKGGALIFFELDWAIVGTTCPLFMLHPYAHVTALHAFVRHASGGWVRRPVPLRPPSAEDWPVVLGHWSLLQPNGRFALNLSLPLIELHAGGCGGRKLLGLNYAEPVLPNFWICSAVCQPSHCFRIVVCKAEQLSSSSLASFVCEAPAA